MIERQVRQSIATAPKDRSILLWFPGNNDIANNAIGWIEGEWNEQEAAWETVIGFLGDHNIPTHWAELPEDPE